MAAQSREQFIRRIMSGAEIGVGPVMLRTILSAFEPYYAATMWSRNKMFDAGMRKQHQLGRPVISVGNITTGGTGKTPVVQWIVRKLIAEGHHPGILLRGYKSKPGMFSDEAQLLANSLGVPVRVNPNRVTGAGLLLEDHPEVDVIILDDGFQHRRASRDFDLVLIDATNPFGYGHVLPRGMLREPLGGLRRASAILLTRSDQVDPEAITQIERVLRQYNPAAPILHSTHAIVRFGSDEQNLSADAIRDKKVFTFCGIGNPLQFHRQLIDLGAINAGLTAFDDHCGYSIQTLQRLTDRAIAAGAKLLVTTEKDWVKIDSRAKQIKLPIWRAQLEIQLPPDHAEQLLAKIRKIIPLASSAT